MTLVANAAANSTPLLVALAQKVFQAETPFQTTHTTRYADPQTVRGCVSDGVGHEGKDTATNRHHHRAKSPPPPHHTTYYPLQPGVSESLRFQSTAQMMMASHVPTDEDISTRARRLRERKLANTKTSICFGFGPGADSYESTANPRGKEAELQRGLAAASFGHRAVSGRWTSRSSAVVLRLRYRPSGLAR